MQDVTATTIVSEAIRRSRPGSAKTVLEQYELWDDIGARTTLWSRVKGLFASRTVVPRAEPRALGRNHATGTCELKTKEC